MADTEKGSSYSNIHGSSIVAHSKLKDVTIAVGTSGSLPSEERNELQRLLSELDTALGPAREAGHPAARRVEKQAEAVAEEVSGGKSDKSYLEITTQGLKQAAESLKDIAPAVLEVVGKIVAFLGKFGLS